MPPSEEASDHFNNEIKIKIAFSEDIFLTYIDQSLTLDELLSEICLTCNFPKSHKFTTKWIDEDGDPCTISSQIELDEAFRLYDINKESELLLYVFDDVPLPGHLCAGEEKYMYKRVAKSLRKVYRINGHILHPKRFNKKAHCYCCEDRIWGLGRQGLKCIHCKILVHKKCHKDIYKPCNANENIQEQKKEKATKSICYMGSSNALPIVAENEKHFGLNDFNLIKVIGRGSYAKVLMVELKKTKRIYAMKVIKKDTISGEEDLDWIQTEKHVFEMASNHPFLIGLHSCFQTSSRLFFVIELAKGGDLMFHMQKKKKLPEFHVQFYAAEISLALNFLHTKGVIFRDLKLDNVLLDHEGHIKLTDYGMCKEGLSHTEFTSTFCGTPNYIAPEILKGKDYNFSVDWWSLGVLLFELLAGRSPFASDDPDHYTEDYLFQTILEKPIRIPRSFSLKATSLIRGLLTKDPSERLGCKEHVGFQEFTNHQFFKSIEWDLVALRKVQPPFLPDLKSDKYITNFPSEFTKEPVKFSPDDPFLANGIEQSEFDGFDYVNPFLMSQEDSV